MKSITQLSDFTLESEEMKDPCLSYARYLFTVYYRNLSNQETIEEFNLSSHNGVIVLINELADIEKYLSTRGIKAPGPDWNSIKIVNGYKINHLCYTFESKVFIDFLVISN